MSVEQAESASAEASVEKSEARSVDDFLADLDAVLADSTAIPGPVAGADAAATMPDIDLSLEVISEEAAAAEPADSPVAEPISKAPATPPAPPAPPAPRRPAPTESLWWNDVYQDDKADQDTFTGNHPQTIREPGPSMSKRPLLLLGAPPQPEPQDPAGTVVLVAEEDEPTDADTDKEDGTEDDTEEASTPWSQKAWSLVKKDYASRKPAGQQASASPPKNGLLNNPRGRKAVFAATAYGAGWSLGLNDRVTELLTISKQYAIPVTGCVLCAGIVGLSMRNRFGGLVFASSLALIALFAMAGPDRFIGGSLILAGHIAYRVVRGWAGEYGQRWPWKGVVWAAHIPAATATVAFLLHDTN